jgi:putative addiction module component (TIGR02574 family)
MSTAAEILNEAMGLPPQERATIAQSLLRSLPSGPHEFLTEMELSAELRSRLEALASGQMPTLDAATTLQRARQAIQQMRQP